MFSYNLDFSTEPKPEGKSKAKPKQECLIGVPLPPIFYERLMRRRIHAYALDTGNVKWLDRCEADMNREPACIRNTTSHRKRAPLKHHDARRGDVARRLAAAARTNNRALLIATESRAQSAALIHARLLSTAQPPPVVAEAEAQRASRVVEAANSRIVKTLAMLYPTKNYEISYIEERIEKVAEYLERRLGMNRLTAIRTIALHPMLVTYTEETMDRKVTWLKRNGVDEDMLKNAVRRNPQILGRSEETFEATKQWFLDQGIDALKIPFLFCVFPQAVSSALDSLDAKVTFLSGVGLDDKQIRRVLQRFPQVMAGNIETMTVKVDAARNLGLTDNEIVKMISLVPEFLLLTMDEVQRKIRFLNKLFGEGTAVRLWVGTPRIVMCNPEQLRRTFQYLNEVVGFSRDRIAAHPKLIMRNVDRLIRPRHEYLRKIKAVDLQRVAWITMSHAQYKERCPDYPAFLATEFKP